MAVKEVTRYALREFVGTAYSKPLGTRLRTHEAASRSLNRLCAQGRDVFMDPMKVTLKVQRTRRHA